MFSTTSHVAIISPDWDFKMIGIGGLDEVSYVAQSLTCTHALLLLLHTSLDSLGILCYISKSICNTCISSRSDGKNGYNSNNNNNNNNDDDDDDNDNDNDNNNNNDNDTHKTCV